MLPAPVDLSELNANAFPLSVLNLAVRILGHYMGARSPLLWICTTELLSLLF
jgi:hypothetical protein